MTIEQAIEIAKQHFQANQLPEAETILRQVLGAQPENAEALHAMGMIAIRTRQFPAAIDLIQRAIRISPSSENFHHNLGLALVQLGQLEQAADACRNAIALWPEFVEAHGFLGDLLYRMGRVEEAIPVFERALSLRPSYLAAMRGLASAHGELNHLDEAIRIYRQAIALDPNDAATHNNLGLLLLKTGRFTDGWPEWEWRRKAAGFMSVRLELPTPPWNREPLAGKRLLLHHEQGYGDSIQFVRYAPIFSAQGAKVILVCPAALVGLFRRIEGVSEVKTDGERLPAFDLHCPIPSIPAILRTQLAEIPANVPYLKTDPARAAFWKSRLAPWHDQLKVGIAWSGRAVPDSSRSVPVDALTPLATIPAITFFNLQIWEDSDQIRTHPKQLNLVDWTGELKDFDDTAALIENLDLIITVDTAIAHLAGAMNKPVWVLLRHAADWRWLLDRTDSPWYPSMRLFRQPKRGDWETPMGEVAESLRAMDTDPESFLE